MEARQRYQQSRRQSDRGIVSRVSTGNVRLRRGEYVTSKDIDSQYERVKHYKFDDD